MANKSSEPEATKDARQQELDAKVKAAKDRVESLRNPDGSVSPENREEFKKAVDELSKAESAAMGESNEGRVVLRTKAGKGKDSKVLGKKEQEKLEKIIQAIIDNGLKLSLIHI